MAWIFYCSDEDTNLMANDKEELAQKVMQHMQDMHGQSMTYDQAMDKVNQSAKQQAA